MLRNRFQTIDGRLQYLTYGPGPLSECLNCNSDNPNSYLYYALPTLVAPHILHLIILGITTSEMFGSKEGAVWRVGATMAAALAAALDIYLLSTHDWAAARSRMMLGQLEFFHWQSRIYRGIGLALLDLALAGCIYLSATNRFFVVPEGTLASRTESAAKAMDLATGKLRAAAIIRRSVMQDATMRKSVGAYWEQENTALAQVYEDHSVLDGLKNALGRVDLDKVTAEAQAYAQGMVDGASISPMPPQPQ
jgi:hypothetical protein